MSPCQFLDLALHAAAGNTAPRDEYLSLVIPSVKQSGMGLAVVVDGMVGVAISSSRLSPIFARGAIERALARTRSQARAALPEIQRSVQPFLQAETESVMAEIEALLR